MQKLLFLGLLIVVISAASNCGGNCPAGNCATCDCGSQKNFTDLEQACSGVSWDKNCCKCVVTRISLGNTNNMVAEGNFGDCRGAPIKERISALAVVESSEAASGNYVLYVHDLFKIYELEVLA
jgi:hypothetical protein